MRVYKFVNWEVAPKDDTITAEKVIKNYNRNCSVVDSLLSSGIMKLGGWAYDIRDELKRFVIKQYGHWREIYAPNKTTARKCIYGRIDEIIEIPNK